MTMLINYPFNILDETVCSLALMKNVNAFRLRETMKMLIPSSLCSLSMWITGWECLLVFIDISYQYPHTGSFCYYLFTFYDLSLYVHLPIYAWIAGCMEWSLGVHGGLGCSDWHLGLLPGLQHQKCYPSLRWGEKSIFHHTGHTGLQAFLILSF